MEKLIIVWGEDDSKRAADEDWKGLENKPTVYYFDSVELRDAFLYGVNEASGWMEYQDLTEPEYKDYLKATHQKEGD